MTDVEINWDDEFVELFHEVQNVSLDSDQYNLDCLRDEAKEHFSFYKNDTMDDVRELVLQRLFLVIELTKTVRRVCLADKQKKHYQNAKTLREILHLSGGIINVADHRHDSIAQEDEDAIEYVEASQKSLQKAQTRMHQNTAKTESYLVRLREIADGMGIQIEGLDRQEIDPENPLAQILAKD